MKKIALIVLAAVAYLVGFGASAYAYDVPTYTRDWNRGYFTNGLDYNGDDVLQNDANDPYRSTHYNGSTGAYDAIPPYVDSAGEFINYIISRLNSTRIDYATANNATNWDRTGAAFLIQTMIGTSRNRPPTSAEINEWAARIYHAEATGHINWGVYVNTWPNTYYQISRWDGSSSLNDVAWYNANGAGTAIVFYHDDGSVAYIIRRNCANPLGNMSPLSDDVNWSASAHSTVDDSTPFPGQTIHFTHYVKNDGPTSTGGEAIWYAVLDAAGATVNGGVSSGAYAAGEEKTFSGVDNVTVPANAAAGTQICHRVLFDRASSAGARNGLGALVCATVTLDYNLNPIVTLNQTTAQDGDNVIFTYKIQNTGSTVSTGAQCYNKDGSGALVGTTFTCSVSQVFAAGTNVTVGTESIPITNQAPGTTICRTLYVQPATPSVPNRASTSACVIVAKTPYVRFGGNDVWAGGGFASALPACNNSAKITTSGRALGGTSPTQYAGSSVEYAAFALNKITAFGSAGKVLVGSGTLGSSPRSLSFQNNEANPALLGYYGAAQHCLTDYAALYASATPLAAGTYDVGARGSGVWRVASGNLHLYGTMPAGATQIYVGVNDLFIDNDIKYPATYANGSDIPSLVVITTHNLAVMSNVKQLDGFYVAQGDGATSGLFRDCWPKTSPQAAGDACDVNQLLINGAVVAGKLELWRSYGGSGATIPARQTPAEIFNFSPELYIRNALSKTNSPLVQVVNTVELPPRF